jgi:hypothetical protein
LQGIAQQRPRSTQLNPRTVPSDAAPSTHAKRTFLTKSFTDQQFYSPPKWLRYGVVAAMNNMVNALSGPRMIVVRRRLFSRRRPIDPIMPLTPRRNDSMKSFSYCPPMISIRQWVVFDGLVRSRQATRTRR